MTVNDLIKFLQDYKEQYPGFADHDVIFSLPKKKRKEHTSFYHTYKATSIGYNSIVSKHNIDIGIERVRL